ncbi:Ger(x)C family spore germination protein [Syntrophomonas erecta subsp. sporosyntropha]
MFLKRYYFDFFMRDYEIRETNWIIVAEGKAADILGTKTKISEISAFYITDLIDERISHSKTIDVNIRDFARMIRSKSPAPTASYIRSEQHNNET